EKGLTGGTPKALEYAMKGHTVWQDKNGIWYDVDKPNYVPDKHDFVQLFQPDPDRGNGAIKQVKGKQTVDEAEASRVREKAGRKVLAEKTLGKLTDALKDQVKEHSEKLIPGSKYAFEAHEALTKAVQEHTQEMAKPSLRRNPGAMLVSEEGGLSNPTSSAQALAARGKTVWKDANGIWYTMDRRGYSPKTPYVEMYRPVRKGPGGGWEWRREGPGR